MMHALSCLRRRRAKAAGIMHQRDNGAAEERTAAPITQVATNQLVPPRPALRASEHKDYLGMLQSVRRKKSTKWTQVYPPPPVVASPPA